MAMFFNGWLGYGASVTGGLLTEPPDSGYARRPFTLGNIDSGIVSDVGSGTVGPAMAPWGAIGYMGLFDAQSGGNLLLWGALPVPLTIMANATITSGTGANRFFFPDLQVAGRNAYVWPAGAPVAQTPDGRILTAGISLQVVNMQLAAQRQNFGTAVTMAGLPVAQQSAGSGLLWNNGGIISVS